MSLFNLDDISSELEQINEEKKAHALIVGNDKIRIQIGKQLDDIKKVIGKIKMGTSIHYASIAKWNMHNLLFYILKQTGPAKIYIATWAISEVAVRQIINHINEKLITEIFAIFDVKVRVNSPGVYELARFNISNIRVIACHAKTTVIINNKWHIAIIGSANYTANPRIECGVICCDKTVANFHKNWILEEHAGANPFEVDKLVNLKRKDENGPYKKPIKRI